jgi:hypothetical protein
MSIDPTPWPPYSQQVIFPPGASDAEICTAVLKGRPEFRPQPPWFLGFVVGFMVAYQLYWLVSVVWFYRLRKKHLRIRMRNFPLVVFQSVLVEWVLIFGPLRDATDPRTWSCDAVLWLRLLYMAVVIVPINLRIFNHYAQYRLQTLVARSKLVALEDGVPHPSAGEDHLMTIQHTSNASETTDSNQRVTFDMLEAQAAQLSFWFNFACTVVAFIPFLIITGIIAAVYPQYNRGCVGCTLSYVEYLASNLGGFVLAPLSLKALLVMKDKPDPLGFMSEMNLTLSVSVAICFPAMFLLSFDAWTGITVTGQFNWEWVNFLGASALHFFAVPYQIWIVTRRFHGGVNLRENLTIFLAIPKARGVFMQVRGGEERVALTCAIAFGARVCGGEPAGMGGD